MSPTSYRTAPPRDIPNWEPGAGRRFRLAPRLSTVARGMGVGKERRQPFRPMGVLASVGRTDVPDDEQFFARFDQAELAAGNFLDRRGILAQPAGLFAQAD